MENQTSFKLHKYLQLNVKTGIVISLLFWIYLILRAYLVPFLHDEIMTYWFYIETGKYLPFTFKINADAANNHVLNSLLTRFFYLIFGSAPFVLRLANLLFIPVYCFFAYKIADTLKNKQLSLLFWLCILLIHTIVDFLALSRGYGMSFALLLGCIWYLIRVMQTGKTVNYFLTLLLLTASLSANLSLTATALMILTFLLINIIISHETIKNTTGKLFILLTAGIIPLCFFVVYSFALQKGGALYYGQQNSFWVISVNTLLKALFNNQGFIIRTITFIYFLLILLMLARYLSKNFSFSVFRNAVVIFPILLTGNIIAVLLLNYLFKVNLPEDRSGFYFYYLFIGSLFFLTDKFAENNKFRRIAWVVIPFILIPLHFAYASNLTHVAVYKDDRVPDRFYETLKAKSESMPEVATIGSYRGRILVLAFQNYLEKGNVGISHITDYPSLIPDFQVLRTNELADWNLYYNAIDYDKVSGYHLLERKHKLQRHTISEVKVIPTTGFINNEFYNLAEGTTDTLTGKSLFFEYDMDIESTDAPFVAWIVIGAADSLNNGVAYEYIPLNWIKPAWNGKSKHYHNGQLLTNIPVNAKTYLTYIWNINNAPFSITNARVTIKELEKEK